MKEVKNGKGLKLREIVEILQAEVILADDENDLSVEMACSSDLMSDVLSFARPGSMLFTGLTTPQVIYTVEIADIEVVCFVRGKRPPEETIRLAEQKGIILLRTNLPMFESCGRLFQHGLKGTLERENR